MLATEVQFQGGAQRFCQQVGGGWRKTAWVQPAMMQLVRYVAACTLSFCVMRHAQLPHTHANHIPPPVLQCARFHTLEEFEGSHRSCRASSARHAERRRQLRRANSAKRASAKRAAAAISGAAAEGGAPPPAKRACGTPPQLCPEVPPADLHCSGQNSGASITPQASTGGAAMPAAGPQLELQGSAESAFDVFSLPPLPPQSLPPMPLPALPLPALPMPASAPAAPAPAASSQPRMSVAAAADLLQHQLDLLQHQLALLQQEQAALQAAQERAAQQLLQLLPATVSALTVVLSSAHSGEVGSLLLLPASPLPKEAAQCPHIGGSPGGSSVGGAATAASSPPSAHTPETADAAVLPPPRSDVGAAFQALAAQQQRDEELLLQRFLAAPAPAARSAAPAPTVPAPVKPTPRSLPSAFRSVDPQPAAGKPPPAAAAAGPSQLLASMLSGATALAKAAQAQAPPAGSNASDLVQATLMWARALAASAGAPA